MNCARWWILDIILLNSVLRPFCSATFLKCDIFYRDIHTKYANQLVYSVPFLSDNGNKMQKNKNYEIKFSSVYSIFLSQFYWNLQVRFKRLSLNTKGNTAASRYRLRLLCTRYGIIFSFSLFSLVFLFSLYTFCVCCVSICVNIFIFKLYNDNTSIIMLLIFVILGNVNMTKK